MKFLTMYCVFIISILSSSLLMAASHAEMISRAGVLIEINSNSKTVKICNGVAIESDSVLTAQHCIIEAGGSYQDLGDVESYRAIDFRKYIFIAGEQSSSGWFEDWSYGEDYFFKKHPGAANIIGYKRLGQGAIDPDNDMVHLLLDRDIISNEDSASIYFNYDKSQWDRLTMVAYAKYDCGGGECLKRNTYSISARANQSHHRQLLYRFNNQSSFHTASFSGSMIIDQKGDLVGLHISSYEGNSEFDKAAFLFDKSNIDNVLSYLSRNF